MTDYRRCAITQILWHQNGCTLSPCFCLSMYIIAITCGPSEPLLTIISRPQLVAGHPLVARDNNGWWTKNCKHAMQKQNPSLGMHHTAAARMREGSTAGEARPHPSAPQATRPKSPGPPGTVPIHTQTNCRKEWAVIAGRCKALKMVPPWRPAT